MKMKTSRHTVVLTAALVGLLVLAVLAPVALADQTISEAGTGAGETTNPQGLAVDRETGRLFVADRGNNRIDVFDSEGHFELAFGWGVKPGVSGFGKCTVASGCKAGSIGAGAGQFDFSNSEGATSIAVDNDPTSSSFHDLYVVDFGNQRVQRFSPAGDFELMFGGGVNTGTSGEPDICTSAGAPTNVCGAGMSGTGEGEFNSSDNHVFLHVALGPGGSVYVAEGRNSEKNRVQRFDLQGHFTTQIALPDSNQSMTAFAVDSAGNLYYAIAGSDLPDTGIHKTDPAGTPIPAYLKRRPEITALAVDGGDELLTTGLERRPLSLESTVIEYDAAGTTLRNFGYGELGQFLEGLAPHHTATGDLYVSQGDSVRYLSFPPPGPIVPPEPCRASPIGNTKATLNAVLNPEGKATTFQFEYISDADFQDNAPGGSFSGAHPATKTAESDPIGPDFDLHEVSAQATLVPETGYHCRIVAENPDGTATGVQGTFTTRPPLEIGTSWVSDVGTETATLNVTVNPLGVPTSGVFEYLEDAVYQKDLAELGPEHGFDHATRTPAIDEVPIDFGAGEGLVIGSVMLSGLKAGTTYRYRVIATDPYFPVGFAGPVEALRTFLPGAAGLPDDRAYELVSPALKNNAEVAVPGTAGGLADETSVRIQAASRSGEAITYTSWTAFGEAAGAPPTSQYISKRSPTGWGTENISPFGFLKNPVSPPYRGFTTPELGFGAFVMDEPPLRGDCQEGFENLYLRNGASGELSCMTSALPVKSPEEAKTFCTGYAGAATDGTRAFFAANASLTPDAPIGKGFSLYEWSASGGLKLVSVLPGETPAAPQAESAFGAKGGGCGMGEKRPAISSDGSVAFWTFVAPSGASKLLARIGGSETIQLDAKAGGTGASGGGVFEGASADGSVVLFTDASKLVAGSDAKEGARDLYGYDLQAGGGTLTDLTPGSLTPGTEAADVRGVVGTSADGAYVYFVAGGVLSGEEENEAGQKAQSGKPNLYLFHEGEARVRFIATLDEGDSLDWDPAPRARTAQVSADGRHLAFSSIATEELAQGYDNTIAAGEHCQPSAEVDVLVLDPYCPQAFVYDAPSGELRCASCNPASSRPLGPTQFPTASNPYQAPRYLAPDGTRLFFESRDALLAEDENDKRDVYEFERTGTGSCSAQSPSFNPLSDGCLFLISTGKSSDESFLLDASADGRDVFIATRQVLVGRDINENFDVYDARSGGGFPEPAPASPPCGGEGCKPAPGAPPAPASPATANFQGPGNVTPKAKKHKKKHKKQRRQKPAKHKQGARR
jgi:hypothetical protein